MFLFGALHGRDHAHHVDGFRHVMHPQDARTLGHGQCCQRQATVQALTDGAAQREADHALARDTYQKRPAEAIERFHVFEKAEVVLEGLGKAEPRIEDDALSPDARSRAGGHTLFKIARNIGCHIFVLWIVLHVARLAPHVHETHRQAGIRRRIKRTVALQGAHVIDQASTEARGFAHDRSSSVGETARAPGRVDSPPTSIRVAPAATISSA
ncbi:hypothetical protein WR25_08734 [Diploscapter pachys]|uniref:Uncharacterized protein n=1 Tax=Diploscapter pachys TaxID=2018661 RepID=A0A2A2K4A8_9BILA|nr:hypothetical protein WR25_08734 [Diploscapter pachys]